VPGGDTASVVMFVSVLAPWPRQVTWCGRRGRGEPAQITDRAREWPSLPGPAESILPEQLELDLSAGEAEGDHGIGAACEAASGVRVGNERIQPGLESTAIESAERLPERRAAGSRAAFP